MSLVLVYRHLDEVKAPSGCHGISQFLDVLDSRVRTDHDNGFMKWVRFGLTSSPSLCLDELAKSGIVGLQVYIKSVIPLVEVREFWSGVGELLLSLVVPL